MKRVSHGKQAGFSLIELCIVMIIVGLGLTVFLQFASTFTEKKRLEGLQRNKNDIQKALVDFIVDDPLMQDLDNTGCAFAPVDDSTTACDESVPVSSSRRIAVRGDYEGQRFPCPADPALSPGDPGYGVEQVALSGAPIPFNDASPVKPGSNVTGCRVTGGIQRVDMGGGRSVYIGALPTETLGLQFGDAGDVYGNKYTYAVSNNLTAWKAASNMDVNGDIEIVRPDMSLSHRAQFIVVSHGSDGKGAYPLAGSTRSACGVTGLDTINCIHDGRFLISGPQEAAGAAYYDDYAFASFGDDINDGWMQSIDTTQQNIRTKNQGSLGIGKDPDTAYKLDVDGTVRSKGYFYD